jgi:preprotein translocase subunit SecF
LDIDRKKANLVNVKEQAQEIKDRQDIEANEEFERVTASISNVEKTIELRVQKEKIAGEKRKQEIQIRLRGLKAKDKVAEQKKAVFDKFYNDIVEISKQPSQDSN